MLWNTYSYYSLETVLHVEYTHIYCIFLSENTVFVSELEKAGVTFIGPNSRAIKDMGDKIASKR